VAAFLAPEDWMGFMPAWVRDMGNPSILLWLFGAFEVALALLMLALGVLPVFSALVSGSAETRASRDRTAATLLATSALERFRRCSPDALARLFAAPFDDFRSVKARVDAAVAAARLPESGPPALLEDPVLWPAGEDGFQEPTGRARAFRVLMAFTRTGPRTGQLACAVLWQDGPASARRTLCVSLGAIVAEPEV
jgi:hypothetical protein